MIAARAWPADPVVLGSGRARVDHDGLPRVVVDGYDYAGFAALGDDVIILDWDTACHREDLHEFARLARAAPDVPLVGPCRIYADGPNAMPEPVWNAKRFNPGLVTMRWVERGEAAHLFGFGMTYVPAALLAGFLADRPGCPLDDTSFSGWFYAQTGHETEIAWGISPVHLHYDPPPGGRL